MSPLSETATNLDLMVALGMKAILVSSSYLGCISPILTALLALQSRGVELAALVLVQVDPQALSTETVLRSLRPHLPAALKLASVPYLGSQSENWLAAPDLTGILT
jgi:dethiobiotin synthetase